MATNHEVYNEFNNLLLFTNRDMKLIKMVGIITKLFAKKSPVLK